LWGTLAPRIADEGPQHQAVLEDADDGDKDYGQDRVYGHVIDLSCGKRWKWLPVRRIKWMFWGCLIYAGVKTRLVWVIKPMHDSGRIGHIGDANT
jgi:hypothetical protein